MRPSLNMQYYTGHKEEEKTSNHLIFKIEGFHVTSYQANSASHLTRDRHVGFLSPQSGIGKYNQNYVPELFS